MDYATDVAADVGRSLLNRVNPRRVVIEPSEEDDIATNKLNLGILSGIDGPILETLIDPKKYPELFGDRNGMSPMVFHFVGTVNQLIKKLKDTYEAGKCPKVIELADKYFSERVGEQAVKEFTAFCCPITGRWCPMILKGDKNYRGDVEARQLIENISGVSFLKALNLPLLWDGSAERNFPALPLEMKMFVLKVLKRLDYLCSFHKYSANEAMPKQVAWYLYNFLMFVLNDEQAIGISDMAMQEAGISPNATSVNVGDLDFSKIITTLMPMIVNYSNGAQGKPMMDSVMKRISADEFQRRMTAYVESYAKRSGKLTKEQTADICKRIMDSVDGTLSKLPQPTSAST